uniref:Calponin-homology (CH) domain-containing protein n=1 Tax=Gasterosteus aculeatus aculeatus TaxID=481459 RepID=A0AAQ4S441_GASAC
MSDILSRWLNEELELSQAVDPKTFARDFSSGYLIGEVLHKYQLQNDFSMFVKKDSSICKLNNFTRVEPTLRLLGISFDTNTAQELMQEKQGVATRLLYQLYASLEKKKKAEISSTLMEIMQPAAIASLHKKEHEYYSDRLHRVVRRDAELKLQKISQHYEEKCQQLDERPVVTQPTQQKRQLRGKGDKRLKNIEVLEILEKIIGQPLDFPLGRISQDTGRGATLTLQSNSKYVQDIRQRLEENAVAREQREKRRDRFLVEQLQAHEAQEEALREEQLVKRLTRQTQQEQRLTTQLLQIHVQKDVIRKNRLFREQQYQQRRERDFQEALEREAALAQQAKLDRAEEIRKELEFCNRIAAERAQGRHKKHFKICKDILEQIVDLATKVGEYRLHTGNLIPAKPMREWKELLFSGLPLYEPIKCQEPGFSAPLDPVELEKQEILKKQDYDEYTNMVGEWAWPEEAGQTKLPPTNNNILGHVVLRVRNIVHPPVVKPSPPPFPHFTIKACVLGKLCSGKTTCLAGLAEGTQPHGIYVLSVDSLIEEALNAYHDGEKVRQIQQNSIVTSLVSLFISSSWITCFFPESNTLFTCLYVFMQPSTRAMQGAAAEKELKEGNTIPNELLVDIVVEAIRQVPAQSGWILDGFPVDINQAHLLEKALGGSVEEGNGVLSSVTELAADPNPPEPAPPAPPALDLALLLDVPDECVIGRPTCIWHRFHKGKIQKKNKIIKSIPATACGVSNIVFPSRITAFQDTWPKLEKWFVGRQNILVRVDANVDEVELHKRVESALQRVMMQTQEGNWLSVLCVFTISLILCIWLPEYLCPHWDTVCDSYVNNVKAVMHQLRSQRSVIDLHLFNIREEYKQYMGRPDLKQELVSHWQKDFNSIPDDMRQDEDTKAELHHRLDELCERLWDICDKRKEKDEKEKDGLMADGWLEEHTALLVNHHSLLLQVELDRFQDTLRILKVYYLSMCRQVLPELPSKLDCIPLLEDERQETYIYHMYACMYNNNTLVSLCSCACVCVCVPGNAAKSRIALVRGHGLVMVQSLQSRAEQTSSSMQESLEAHYLAGLKSVEQLSEVVGHHIQAGAKLQKELVLECTDFHLNGDCHMVASPAPPPRPPPHEKPMASTPTVTQLESLRRMLHDVAPSGLISNYDLFSLLMDIISVSLGRNTLPEPWLNMDETQLLEIVSLLKDSCELIDWRRFLLSAALPWPFPSSSQLLDVLRRFKAADTGNTAYVNEEQYLQTKLWFSDESGQPVPEDPSEPLPNDRLANLRKFFFQLFADRSFSPPRLDYVCMLQYFAADPDPRQGFIRALSVVLGQHLMHSSHNNALRVQSMPSMQEAAQLSSSDPDADYKVEDFLCASSASPVNVQSLRQYFVVRIINHIIKMKLMVILLISAALQQLVRVFRELGYTPEDCAPFSVLSQHPFIQHLMETSTHHQLVVSLHAHKIQKKTFRIQYVH